MDDNAKFVRKQLLLKAAFIGIGVGAVIITSGVLSSKEITTLTNTL